MEDSILKAWNQHVPLQLASTSHPPTAPASPAWWESSLVGSFPLFYMLPNSCSNCNSHSRIMSRGGNLGLAHSVTLRGTPGGPECLCSPTHRLPPCFSSQIIYTDQRCQRLQSYTHLPVNNPIEVNAICSWLIT